MTGAEIITAILANSFESSSANRALALTWANAAYGWMWGLEEWSFKQGTDAVTVTANSAAVTGLAADFGTALHMQRADGTWLEPIDEYRDYAARYLGTDNISPGLPEAFCAQYGAISVGPVSSETSAAYLLIYEKALTALADGSVEPTIPSEAHLGIVFGGKARGYRLANVDHAVAMETELERVVESLRRSYLRAARGTATQTPAYRPGGARW